MDFQLGVAAAAFMGFRASGELTFDLRTFDGYFGFPVDVSWDIWAARFQWAHVSAHTADGIRKDGAPDPSVVDGAWSREYWQLQGGPQLEWWRAYYGVMRVTHSVHDSPQTIQQFGGEIEAPQSISPYVAGDLRLQPFDSAWSPTYAGEVGLRFEASGHRLRVGVTGYTGLEDTGKFEGLEEHYVGLTLGMDSTGALGI